MFFENRAIYEIMWKNVVESEGYTGQYGACAFYAGYVRLHIHTQIMQFVLLATATMVACTCLSVTLHVHSPCFYYLLQTYRS
jgi:hypothetical protein